MHQTNALHVQPARSMFDIPLRFLPAGYTGKLREDSVQPRFQHEEGNPTNLLWLDFETTGLDTQKDHILEIATRFTDRHGVQEAGFETVVATPEYVLQRISDPWILETHEELLKLARDPTQALPFYFLDLLLYAWLTYFGSTKEKPTIHLAGNSVWFDRAFLSRLLPNAFALLNYRQIDVSSVELFFKTVYGELPPELKFEKKKLHRSVADLKETLGQYRHYQKFMTRFQRNPSNPDDIRAKGWSVAVHNDYRQNSQPHTFWLFTKGDFFAKGEGLSDSIALNQVREEIKRIEGGGSLMG
jgi:oligoribonuclease